MGGKTLSLTKKQYLKLIYQLLPYHGTTEKRFYADFNSSIDDFCELHNNPTYDDLISEFGTPSEVVSEFLKAQSSDYLLKQLNRKKIHKIGLAVIIVVLIAALSVFSTFCYKAYLDSKNSVITHEETFITELQ